MVAYSFKKQFIQAIDHGLRGHLDEDAELRCWPKRQTIRAVGKRRHARPGETIQLYTAMRTKQCRKLGEAKCASVTEIRIFVEKGEIYLTGAGRIVSPKALDMFARNDGFADWPAMREFWRKEHPESLLGPFVGLLIKWEPSHG